MVSVPPSRFLKIINSPHISLAWDMCIDYTAYMRTKEKQKERTKEMGKRNEQSGEPAGRGDEGERYKLCPSCGNFADFNSNETYCILCGTKLLDACPECHAPIHYPTAKFCPSCGEKYDGAA